MRIAEIAPVWVPVPPPSYGGIELVVSLLADGLTERGHDVTLFAGRGSHTAATLVSPVERSNRLEDLGDDITDEVVHALPAYLEAGDFDVIHDHTGLGTALGAVLDNHPPVVHTLHGPWTDASRRFFEAVSPPVHLIAISQAQADGNPDVNYAGVVHNGLDLDAHPWSKEKDDYVVFLGRCNAEKGPEVAVEAANRAGVPLTIMIKRSEPQEHAYWEEHVVPVLSGDERIIFDTGHDEKVELLGRARATLVPIQWPEPFGLVMIESMACGTPVIAMSRGAAPEIVDDGTTGFLVDDIDGMVEALGRVDSIDPEACRDRVSEKFSADALVTGTERVLEEVVRTAHI
ncbi:MAG: glycosyltransferase family 4 protein [Acidimicrobiales bacterium]